MGWETRIFFEIKNEEHKNVLSLDNPQVSEALFSTVVRLDSGTEDRADEYVHLSDCPNAGQIGLKARGGSFQQGKLELKLVERHAMEGHEAACWTKHRSVERHNSRGSRTDAVRAFLCQLPSQDVHVKQLQEWLDSRGDGNDLDIVRVEKKRRLAGIGRLQMEETDCCFVWGESSAVHLRSWAVEGNREVDVLCQIASNWKTGFEKAVKTAGMSEIPSMWIRSYPSMVLEIPKLLHKQASA